MSPELVSVRLADPAERWEALGFSVNPGEWNADMNYSPRCSSRPAGAVDIGGVRLELGGQGRGIAGWTLTGIPSETREIDGLPTALAEPSSAGTSKHPNGAIGVDHVVLTTPDFDRTAAALEAAGLPLRRVAERRDGARMGFRRLGPAILELVEAADRTSGMASRAATRAADSVPAPARFWGLVVVVQDLDALAERLGDRVGSIRQAVQPGRRIATLRESAGLGEAVAFMTPEGPS